MDGGVDPDDAPPSASEAAAPSRRTRRGSADAGSTDPGSQDTGEASGRNAGSTTAEGAPGAQRLILLISSVVLAVAVLALAFFVGTRLGRNAPVSAPSPTPSPSVTAPAPTPTPEAVVGPLAPGTYPWKALAGDECIDPFTSPWAEEFAVVDCGAPHAAQLLVRGAYPADAAAPYPGDAALTADLNLLCTAPEVLDLAAAGAYADLQIQPAYPPDETSWATGERSYFCFAFRSSGQPLTGLL